jgi:5-hydroxyisourate hydrolase-like protein (transthyretin family)
VKIVVSVIDGMRGRAAEGVRVSLVIHQATEPPIRADGLTDTRGNFRYSAGSEGLAYTRNCGFQIDVDEYFASLGIVASCKQIALQARLTDTDGECHLVAVITPFALAGAVIR